MKVDLQLDFSSLVRERKPLADRHWPTKSNQRTNSAFSTDIGSPLSVSDSDSNKTFDGRIPIEEKNVSWSTKSHQWTTSPFFRWTR